MSTHPNSESSHPYLNPDLSLARRIDDLVARLTLAEKINQLVHENNAIPRLGIPAYNWWSEACHGVGRNGRATVFPQVIGLAGATDRKQSIYDPTCGSGSLLLKAHDEAKSVTGLDLAIYGGPSTVHVTG